MSVVDMNPMPPFPNSGLRDWPECGLLRGQLLWITGAAQGIGAEVVRQAVRQGARVVALDHQFSAPVSALSLDFGKSASDFGEGEVRCCHFDLANSVALPEQCRQLLALMGPPDGVVNAAGVLELGAFESLTLSAWQRCFSVNVSGVFQLLQQLIPSWQQRRRGAVVNIASNAAHVPRVGMAAYCASKAALVSLSHCFGLEMAAHGVRCNLVSPGSTATPMFASMQGCASMLNDATAVERTVRGLPEQYKLGIPLQKIATPQEVANSVLFLLSDLASHITLHDLVIDGGATLAA